MPSLVASFVAIGFAGSMVAAPSAAFAGAPCARAENYAAQAGAESVRIDRLRVGPAAGAGGESDEGSGSGGKGGGSAAVPGALPAPVGTLRDVGLGEARAAMVGTSPTSSAAVGRILDAAVEGTDTRTKPLLQQAPPGTGKPDTRGTPAGRIGPLTIGRGEVSVRARWEPGMACGRAAGEPGRSRSVVEGLSILGGGDAVLVRVPQEVTSVSTTALELTRGSARTVAEATVTAGVIELAGGKVRVRVLRPPTLMASMTRRTGGQVRYRPALIEVSGDGIATRRLDTAGDHVDVTLGSSPPRVTESLRSGGLRGGSDLPLPAIPGLPTLADPAIEPAPDAGMRISLGKPRKASKGHVIAARVTAINVAFTQGDESVQFGVGLLEAAAVIPARSPGLPVTGPRVGDLITTGGGLIIVGAMVIFATRRRRCGYPPVGRAVPDGRADLSTKCP